MKVLFSPVGGTDPISNFRDGAFLHICRHYKPDKVKFFMSKEIYAYHLKDNRYIYCLEKLGEKLNHKFNYEIIEKPEFTQVQDFDLCMSEFDKILLEIVKESKKDDVIYLNISSGTPAMKAALLLKAVLLTGRSVISIQVSTPEKKMNYSIEDRTNYEVKEQWKANEDNEENTENRCTVVESATWRWEIQRENIKKHINAYNYVAALDILDEAEYIDKTKLKKYLIAASDRLKLDIDSIKSKNKDLYDKWIPVKDNIEALNILEYALAMDIKVKKEEYADFIRSISPILLDLYEIIIRAEFNIDVEDCVDNSNDKRTWNVDKVKNHDLLKTVKMNNKSLSGDIGNGNLYEIINILRKDKKFTIDLKLIETLRKIHNVERKMRNPAAHEIVSITDEKIKIETGMKSREIFNAIKWLVDKFIFRDNKSQNTLWDSYNKMNKEIIKELDAIKYK